MKPHVKLYLNFFNYAEQDYMPCEIIGCTRRAVDIHHIHCRGMGGTKKKDTIENLIGLCREHHIKLGDKKEYFEVLKAAHNLFIEKSLQIK